VSTANQLPHDSQSQNNDTLLAADMGKNYCSLHDLRATTATLHVGCGLEIVPLQSMFDWVQQ